MKKIFNILFLTCALQFSWAQVHEAKINTVAENGLHQIILSPDALSATQNKLSSIRIFDAKNNEVPYVVFNQNTTNSQYKTFGIISKNAIPNVATSVILSNESQLNLDHLILKIGNTEVEKKYSISGSNDQLEWFGLVNNQVVRDLSESGSTSVSRVFSFPLNNYKFIKFDFIDKNSLPINVLEIGLEKSFSVAESKVELQNFQQKITTDKTTKKTRIAISFKNPQVIDGIYFTIQSPNFYLRDARILVNKTIIQRKQKNTYEESIANLKINSKTNNQFALSHLYAKEFVIEIDNQDNPPLEFKKIGLLQTPISLLSDLKANENYVLKIDPKLSAPTYDLAQSDIKFSKNYPQTSVTNLTSLEDKDNPNKANNKKKSFWQTTLFMWICIVLAVAIIGYFAIMMIKDMNKEN
ncbi:hypothetical protein [Chryseobacterium sp.]|uniref:hypothetical protein n=1 Tax=Chryseobacterium sp. TaxID=1871047 RepID=UPI00388F03AB